VIVRQLDLQLPVHSMPITSNVVSPNPTPGEAYSIQLYVIMFVNDMWHPVSSTNKTDRHNITETLLTVALNIITLTLTNKHISNEMYDINRK
jgi:hypothetical protein